MENNSQLFCLLNIQKICYIPADIQCTCSINELFYCFHDSFISYMVQNKRHIFAGVIMTDGQSTNPYKLEDIIMKVKLKGIEIFSIGKYL